MWGNFRQPFIQASFAADERPRAVGAWSGLGGVAAAIGPVLGGWLVQTAGVPLPGALASLADREV